MGGENTEAGGEAEAGQAAQVCHQRDRQGRKDVVRMHRVRPEARGQVD